MGKIRYIISVILLIIIVLSSFYLSKKSAYNLDIIYGNWSKCAEGQIKQTYSLDKLGNLTRHKKYYKTDSACQGDLSYEHIYHAKYNLYDKKDLGPYDQMKLDLTITHVEMVTFDHEITNIYNERTVCDFGDWKIGIKKTITGIHAEDCKQYEKGKKIYRYIRFGKNHFKLGNKSFSSEKRSENFKIGRYNKE